MPLPNAPFQSARLAVSVRPARRTQACRGVFLPVAALLWLAIASIPACQIVGQGASPGAPKETSPGASPPPAPGVNGTPETNPPRPPETQPVPEAPPPVGFADDTLERAIRVIPDVESREERVIDGKRTIRVRTRSGLEYLLTEDDGVAVTTLMQPESARLRVPNWILLEW